MRFIQEAFDEFVIEQGVIGFFEEPITLKSGRVSDWYANWRTPASDVYAMDELSGFVVGFVQEQGLEPDCFYGVPEGATKLAVITQYKWAKTRAGYGPGSHPLVMGRGKPKEHGAPKDRYFLGVPQGETIVLEDVTTTGGSLLATIDNLLDAGVSVVAAIGLTNRNELRDDGLTVKEVVEQKGLQYLAMSNALTLLPKAAKAYNPPREVLKNVEQYFKKHGSQKIKF
ncbi:hypothetical protein GF352_03725 [archaeon]|nr:hypothetical protein [archaeon]